MENLVKFLHWCQRYITAMGVVVVVFVVYTMFLQENSIFRYMSYSNTIDSLRVEIKNYTDTMNYYHKMNSLLTTDPEVMERVVREEYNMNRRSEDVYIFE